MNRNRAMSGSARKPLLIALAAFTFGTAGNAFAAAAGEVSNLSGTLSVKRADGTSKLLAVKSEVQPGDTLATEAGTYARVKFIDGGEVVLRPGTLVNFQRKFVSLNGQFSVRVNRSADHTDRIGSRFQGYC